MRAFNHYLILKMLAEKEVSTKGWNWGYYHMREDKVELSHDKEGQKKCLSIQYKDIALSNATNNTEVTLELANEDANKRGGDILCEMRFFIPNNLVAEGEEQEALKKEKVAGEDSDYEITPGKILNDKIIAKAGLRDSAGDVIACFLEIPLIVPRGKYNIDMYENYAKFHGKTHVYRIMYKDIIRMFQLPRVDRPEMVIILI